MKTNVYTLNSFAKTKEGGNPAGVVMNADLLSEEKMQKIAAILGFSETAFVLQSSLKLLKQDKYKKGKYTQETKAGILGVEIHNDNFVMMDQPIPVFFEIIDKDEIAASLNISTSQFVADLPVQVVSTGLRDILVPIKSIELLDAIRPNMKKVKEISRRYHTVGYHVFTLQSLHGGNAYCRNFAPSYGIMEEAATGTSNGALGCYLHHYGKINEEQASHIIFEQGYSMNKPSEICVSLAIKENKIFEVKVGGRAMNLTIVEVEI